MVKIAPSVLAADFSKLGKEIESVKSADILHFDVMDGVFVPNISFGLPVLSSVRKITDMPLDVHLMIQTPSKWIGRFAEAGADTIVFHVEAENPESIKTTISNIKALGKRPGLSLRPNTPAAALLPYLDTLDTVLVMTVEPGFGGQGFMPDILTKISEIRQEIDRRGSNCEIEVDGGINYETAKLCVKAGATVLVTGSFIFKTNDRASVITKLRTNAANP